MPKISPYILQTEVPGPERSRTLSGADFGAGSGTGVAEEVARQEAHASGRLGSALTGLMETGADLMKLKRQHEERLQLVDLQAKLAESHAKYSQALERQFEEGVPGDRLFSDRFLTVWDKHASAIQQDATTPENRAYVSRRLAEIRNDFAVRSMQQQSHLVGLKVKEDRQKYINSVSSSVYDNPGTWQQAIARYDADSAEQIRTGATTPQFAAQMRSKDLAEIARSAAFGFARNDPSDAKLRLARGEFNEYIDGTDKRALDESFQRLIEARQSREEHALRMALMKKELGEKTDFETVFRKVRSEGYVDPDDPAFSRLSPAHQREIIQIDHVINKAVEERQLEEDSEEQAQAFSDVYERILTLKPTDPGFPTSRDVGLLLAGGVISRQDHEFLQRAIEKNPEHLEEEAQWKLVTKVLQEKVKMAGILKMPDPVSRYRDAVKKVREVWDEMAKNGVPVSLRVDKEAKDSIWSVVDQFVPTQADYTKAMSVGAGSLSHAARGALTPSEAAEDPATSMNRSAAKLILSGVDAAKWVKGKVEGAASSAKGMVDDATASALNDLVGSSGNTPVATYRFPSEPPPEARPKQAPKSLKPLTERSKDVADIVTRAFKETR